MVHQKPSPLAGQRVQIKSQANALGGKEILIEDWWDRIAGKSWMDCDGNIACLGYAMRTGLSSELNVPINNEVVYGKIANLGYLVNVAKLEAPNIL